MLPDKKGGDIEAGTSGAAAATRELYPGMTENPELRWVLTWKIYAMLSLLLFAVVVAVVVMSTGAGGEGATIIAWIINPIGLALCVDQFYMDWRCADGDLVFSNFSLANKLVSCFKLYVTGYDAVHTTGSEMFGFVCLLGCTLHSFAILYHLPKNHKTWVRTRVLGMLCIMAAGVSLLCEGMVIHNVWNTNVVPAIIIFIVLIDGGLLVHA